MPILYIFWYVLNFVVTSVAFDMMNYDVYVSTHNVVTLEMSTFTVELSKVIVITVKVVLRILCDVKVCYHHLIAGSILTNYVTW